MHVLLDAVHVHGLDCLALTRERGGARILLLGVLERLDAGRRELILDVDVPELRGDLAALVDVGLIERGLVASAEVFRIILVIDFPGEAID